MPRIENIGDNVSEYCERTGEGSSTFDICTDCASHLETDPHVYDAILSPYNGDPEGDEGYEAGCVHPDYDEEGYLCTFCYKPLTSIDD